MSLKKTPFFELRSGSVDTLLFVVKTTDLETLKSELTRRFETTPEFFANDVVALDVRRLEGGGQVPLADLARLLEQFRMRAVGVVATPEQQAWAVQSGLPLLEAHDRRAGKAETLAAAEPVPAAASAGPSSSQDQNTAPKVATAPSPGAAISTMVVEKPLRSGQQIYAKGDLIVLGVVSYGAEIIAEGNIHVYAPLRGRALAGVHGNHEARIYCTCLEPELISIAGIYRTAETPLPDGILGQAVQVRLDREKLIIEPLKLK